MHGVDEFRVKLWIEALRSGEFKQTKQVLEESNPDGTKSHCCLGVAMHVALRNGWEPREGVERLNWGPESMDPGAGAWFGFQDGPSLESIAGDPYLGRFPEVVSGRVHCTSANDELDWSFEKIADALEARYITPTTPDTSKESNSNA